MKLAFQLPESEADHRMFPHGYWVAEIRDGDYDGVGETPLAALAAAVVAMENDLRREGP